MPVPNQEYDSFYQFVWCVWAVDLPSIKDVLSVLNGVFLWVYISLVSYDLWLFLIARFLIKESMSVKTYEQHDNVVLEQVHFTHCGKRLIVWPFRMKLPS